MASSNNVPSSVSEHCELMLRETQRAYEEGLKLKGARIERVSKEQTLNAFETFRLGQAMSPGSENSASGFSMRPYFITKHYPPCTLPIKKLQSMVLDDLRVEKHHDGKVLFVQVSCDPTFFGTAIIAIIEDEDGNADRLILVNQDCSIDACQTLRKGDILAIKQPYYEMAGKELPMIRIDHISDLVFLEPNDHLAPPSFLSDPNEDADTWKIVGNDAMKIKDYAGAIRAYTRGLCLQNHTPRQVVEDLHRNRAQAYLSAGYYENALKDCIHVLIRLPNDEKALFRAARAQYELGQYTHALHRLRQIRTLYPANEFATRLAADTQTRLEESLHGKYNFALMFQSSSPGLNSTPASYTRAVTIRPTPSAGRGLFATRPFAPGELILLDAPFATSALEHPARGFALIDIQSGSWDVSDGPPLFAQVLAQLRRTPSAAPRVLALFSGSYPAAPGADGLVDGAPVLDAFRVHELVRLNSGSPSAAVQRERPGSGQTVGLWLSASYANHACNPNAAVSFAGEALLIRALRGVDAGEEVTIGYCTLEPEREVRRGMLKRVWGFECACRLCVLEGEGEEELVERRKRVLEEHERVLEKGEAGLEHVRRTMVELEETYGEGFERMPRLIPAFFASMLFGNALEAGEMEVARIAALACLRNFGWFIECAEREMPVLDRTNAILPFGHAKDVANAFVYLGNCEVEEGRNKVGELIYGWAREIWGLVTCEPGAFEREFSVEEVRKRDTRRDSAQTDGAGDV